MIRRRASHALVLAAALLLAGCDPGTNQSENAGAPKPAAEKQALVSSEYDVVRAMLTLANVTKDDLVVDLGSGDGRIPIMAARERGARGLGIEIDRGRIRQSRKNAEDAGVADRVQFRQEDLFVTPLDDVTVLTLYLLPEINLQLRPKILSQMRPGARVVSNTWDMGDWRPDQTQAIGGANIFLWVVPARVEGRWQLNAGGRTLDLQIDQQYQTFGGTAGGAPIAGGQLRGSRIAFTADLGQGPQRFEGEVEGDRMTGAGWSAVRVGGGG